MTRRLRFALAALCSFAAAGAAQANTIYIDGLGGEVALSAGNLTNVLGSGAPAFTTLQLAAVHASIQSSGVNTDGVVTFLLAYTGSGLTFMTLVDDQNAQTEGPVTMSHLGMTSTAPATAQHWINDYPNDIQTLINPFGITQTAAGQFNWNGEHAGDGFAWSNLEEGDGLTFNFSDMGGSALNNGSAFQFLTWTGNQWQIVSTGSFSETGQFAFSAVVVPLPAPVLMGIAGLAGVAVLSRRRRANKA